MWFILLIIFVLSLIIDSSAFADGSIYKKLWCKIGVHRNYTISAGGHMKDLFSYYCSCRVCDKYVTNNCGSKYCHKCEGYENEIDKILNWRFDADKSQQNRIIRRMR